MSRNLEILEQVQQDRELFRVPCLTKRAEVNELASAVSSRVPPADGFGQEELIGLVQRLFLAVEDHANSGPRQVVFCAVDQGDVTGALCASLGQTLASQVTSQVCIVDANVRMPVLHRLLAVDRSNGQTLLEGETKSPFLQQITGNLWLISGHPATENGGVTASLNQVQSQMQKLPPEFAYVVINAPPVGMYNDAVLLGQKADGIVLVLEANSTRRVAARKAKQALEAANIQVLGTVLNNRTFPIPEKIYRLL